MIRWLQRGAAAAPVFLLALWGVFILFLHQAGVLGAIQHPRFKLITLAAGLLLLLAAAAVPFLAETTAPRSVRLTTGRLGGMLVGLAPVLLFLFFPRDTFSAARLLQKTTTDNTAPIMNGAPFVPDRAPPWANIPPDTAVALEVTDVVWANGDPQLRQSLIGHKVKLTGQYVPDEGARNSYKLVRLIMVCCAADAQAVGVEITGAPPAAKEGAWLEVEGAVRDPAGRPLAVAADRTLEVPAPPDPYLQ